MAEIAPKLYHYRNEDGLYTRWSFAKKNPLPDPDIADDEYLIRVPGTTLSAPNQDVLDFTKAGYWLGNSWSSVAWPIENETTTKEAIILWIIKQIDETTSSIIKTGFFVGDQQVSLTVEDQQNYFNKFMALWLTSIQGEIPAGTFPFELPVNTTTTGATVYISISNFDEYTSLFNAGNNHIEDARNAGRLLKSALLAKTMEELKAWEDPRLTEV